MSYEQALTAMDGQRKLHEPGFDLVKGVTRGYADSIAYVWPDGLAHVPMRDNWILHVLGCLDGWNVRAGLTEEPDLFSEFQSLRYERGFGRGFGICSQHSLGLVDLLNRRYGIDASVVGLEGHVIIEAQLPEGPSLHDPSLGISFPFGLDDITPVRLASIRTRFAELGRDDFGRAYDAPGNLREPPGVRGYQPRIYLLERAADWLKWLVPALLLGTGAAIERTRLRAAPE